MFCFRPITFYILLHIQELYSLQKEKEEAKQHCDVLEREKLRMERQLEDTSTQVQAKHIKMTGP